MRIRLLALCGLLLGALATTAGPAAALSCVAPPPDVAEVTITGELPADGWYGDAEVPAVIGRIVEGTPQQPEAAGDRLALVEVIGGLRLDTVPTEIEIIADDLIGWGHPTYAVGDHVFLRIDEWNVAGGDLAGGIADGPCSWNQRYSATEIESLLTLADDHGVPFVAPTPVADNDIDDETSTTSSTTAPSTTAPPTTAPPPTAAAADDAEPIATSDEGDEGDGSDDDGGASVAVVIGAVLGVALLGAGAYVASSRR